MIYDEWKNFPNCTAFRSDIAAAIADFHAKVTPDMKNGKYELSGNLAYASVFDSKTSPELEKSVWETHQEYTDIQTLLVGTEINYRRDPEGLVPTMEYNSQNDYQLFKPVLSDDLKLTLDSRRFVIYFPGEAHLTSFNTGDGISRPIRKLVFKIHKSLLATR